MPTDENTEVNASEQTETTEVTKEETTTESPTAETLTEDAVKAHPTYIELKEKHAAAREGMDGSNLSNKELKAEVARLQVLAGVEGEVKVEEEEKPLTRAELDEKLWLLQNAESIKIYSDEEYEQDIKDGIPKEYALKTAKLRGQSDPDKVRLARQKLTASGPSTSHRDLESSDEITDKDRENMKIWGYSEAAIKKQKQLKKERGQI